MQGLRNTFNTLKTIHGKHYYSLPALELEGVSISRLPVSLRIMLESLLRHCDGMRVKEEDIIRLAKWEKRGLVKGEAPFVVARVLLQDFTGVPLVVDLAAMRDAVAAQNCDPATIEPNVPVDLVVDHSVQVDRAGTSDAYEENLALEFQRNQERYTFLKWGEQAFKKFKVVPPGIGIVHQVNLEHLAEVVVERDGVIFPDTLVGTDSHTTMVNGLGVVAWGVGGIEAQAAMLSQPVTIPIPEVIGVHLSGRLQEGVTATDLTLRITEILRKENVVDKFVEFFGEGAATLSVADRATIGNMSPEYGATMGFFPADEKTVEYLRLTGRDEKKIAQMVEYLKAQNLFGIPRKGEVDFTKTLELDLNSIVPCVSGPKRPQDRIDLSQLKSQFSKLLVQSKSLAGYEIAEEKLHDTVAFHLDGTFSLLHHHQTGGKQWLTPGAPWSEAEMVTNRPFTHPDVNPGYSEAHPSDALLTHGSIVIAAITSCTNTSNPSVMVAAGLLAKKAVEKGLKVNPLVKASLAPGSRVVTEYLKKTGLQPYLDALEFNLVAYGCTTCIGNSGPLDEKIETAIKQHDLVVASVLSGNRNFEARIHSAVKANFLMSPPLVVAFAIAGRVNIDMESEPLGKDKQGLPVFLKDIWPSSTEVEEMIAKNLDPAMFKERYARIHKDNPMWGEIGGEKGVTYNWSKESTYIQKPPYFDDFTRELPIQKTLNHLTCLAIFGDSVTTDHISPAGAFASDSAAGKYLLSLGVSKQDFNSYGSRRGNHNIMMRGTFANVRIKNKMIEPQEGGFAKLLPEGKVLSIFEAAEVYAERKQPLIIFGGKDYGMGSSRDWAAKGTALLGVRAVITQSFERIHRSNLVGMGVLPLTFSSGDSVESLGIKGDETFAILGLEKGIVPGQELMLEIKSGEKVRTVPVRVRIDTPIEVEYYRHGGIMPYVLRQFLK